MLFGTLQSRQDLTVAISQYPTGKGKIIGRIWSYFRLLGSGRKLLLEVVVLFMVVVDVCGAVFVRNIILFLLGILSLILHVYVFDFISGPCRFFMYSIKLILKVLD